MSYAQAVTYIDDLPELDDIENVDGPKPYGAPIRQQLKESKYPGGDLLPPEGAERYQKFIRGTHQVPHDAGMESMVAAAPPPEFPADQGYGTDGELMVQQRYHLPPGSPSCIDVANHIEVCPICSRYYKGDKSIYLVAIVVLAVLCLLLLKRVLNA